MIWLSVIFHICVRICVVFISKHVLLTNKRKRISFHSAGILSNRIEKLHIQRVELLQQMDAAQKSDNFKDLVSLSNVFLNNVRVNSALQLQYEEFCKVPLDRSDQDEMKISEFNEFFF